MSTALLIMIPLFGIGLTIGAVLGYHKWINSWVRPWVERDHFDVDEGIKEAEDYANWGRD